MFQELKGNPWMVAWAVTVSLLLSWQVYLGTVQPQTDSLIADLPDPIRYVLLSQLITIQLDSCYNMVGHKHLKKEALVAALVFPYAVLIVWITLIN